VLPLAAVGVVAAVLHVAHRAREALCGGAALAIRVEQQHLRTLQSAVNQNPYCGTAMASQYSQGLKHADGRDRAGCIRALHAG
jgi:hypothetical protein